MMNRFFTLLLAASCLTAVGQGGGECTDCLACNYGQIGNCVYPPIDGQTCSGGCLGFGSDPYGGSAVVDVAVAFQDPQIMELWVNIFNSIDPSLSSAIGQVMLTINDEVYGTLEMNGPLVDGCGVDDGFGYGYWTYENFNFIPMTHSLWQCGSNELSLIHVPPAISLCAPVVIWEGTVDNPLIPVDAVGVCGGDCELDWNGNGVCDDIEVFGCTYSSANNFNSLATADDGSCVFENNVNPPCGEGTVWDAVSLKCIVANPADINFDGCVQLEDLLTFLVAYGGCPTTEPLNPCDWFGDSEIPTWSALMTTSKLNASLGEFEFGPTDAVFRLYFLEVQGGASSDYFVEDPSAPLEFVYTGEDVVRLTGRIHCRENTNQWFDVDVVFDDVKLATDWLNEDPMTNALLIGDDPAISGYQICPVDTSSLLVMTMASPSLLVAGGELEGYLVLQHAPAAEDKRFQLGCGGNNHNCNFGLGGWFSWSGEINGQSVASPSGDIVGDLELLTD